MTEVVVEDISFGFADEAAGFMMRSITLPGLHGSSHDSLTIVLGALIISEVYGVRWAFLENTYL